MFLLLYGRHICAPQKDGRVEKTDPRSTDYPTDYSTDYPTDYSTDYPTDYPYGLP